MEGQEKKMLEKAKVLLKSADSCMQQLETQEELKQQLKLSKDSLLKQVRTQEELNQVIASQSVFDLSVQRYSGLCVKPCICFCAVLE